MGFYDSLAQRYGIPGVDMNPGFAEDLFNSGLAAFGDRQFQRSANPMQSPTGPMAGDVIDKQIQQRMLQQQALEEIQRQMQQRAFDEAMQSRGADRLEGGAALDVQKQAMSEEEFKWRQQRAIEEDALKREGQQTQKDIANSYASNRGGSKSSAMTGDPASIQESARRVGMGPGNFGPEDVIILQQNGLLTQSRAGELLASLQPERPTGDLNDQTKALINQLEDKITAEQKKKGRGPSGPNPMVIARWRGEIESSLPG